MNAIVQPPLGETAAGSGGGAKQHLMVSILPWAGLKSTVHVGPVEIWPATDEQLEARVPDVATREHLHAYFGCYVTERGAALECVNVCTLGQNDFRELTPEEHTVVRRAVDALLFAVIGNVARWSVARDDSSNGPPTAERFQLVHQNFRPGHTSLAVQSGPNLHGGLDLSTARFTRPMSVGGWDTRCNDTVLSALGRLLTEQQHETLRDRVFRALEWFRLAHIGADEVSELSRVVMMATAFEVLVQAPRHGKTVAIAQAIDARVATQSHARHPTTIGRQTIDLSPVGQWGANFYDLRSRVVHGDSVPAADLVLKPGDWITQLIAADLLLWEFVIRGLHGGGLVDTPAKKLAALARAAFPNADLSELERTHADAFLRSMFGFSAIHERFGWLPARRRERTQ